MAGSKTVLAIFRPIVWLAVIVLYLLVGGGIFFATEAEREDLYFEDHVFEYDRVNRSEVKANLSRTYNLSPDAVDEIFKKMLDSDRVYAEKLSIAPGWSFLTSCMYAMTVLTTTGKLYSSYIPLCPT